MHDFIFLDDDRTLGFTGLCETEACWGDEGSDVIAPGRIGRVRNPRRRRRYLGWGRPFCWPSRWRIEWRMWLSSSRRRRQQRIADLWEY